MCGVWLSTNIIQHTNTATTTFIDYEARLLLKLGFFWPIEFDALT
jgi:hypothetical protein